MLSFLRFVFLFLLILLLMPSAAQADIPFQTNGISTYSWPWPAAVAPEWFIAPVHGVVWADFTSVQYSYSLGTDVYHETVVSATDVGRIAAATNGGEDIHACFRAQVGEYGLRYAHRDIGGTWDSEWVATGTNVGHSCAVGILDGIGPVVAYVEETSTFGRTLKYATRNILGWNAVDIDQRVSGDPLFTGVTMATDGAAAVHLAWTTGDQVRYSQGPYTAIEVVTAVTGAYSLAIAIARDDQPRLAILDNGELLYATRSDTGWTVEPVLPDRDDVQEMSMAVGYEDVPHIVFVTNEATDPVFLATEFLGDWVEQPLTNTPTFGTVQRPSIAAASPIFPSLHLTVAWNGEGALKSSNDIVNAPSFAVPRLRASPLGELVSTVDLYSTTQYPMESQWVVLDFTAPGVMDTVNFCYTYKDTVRRRTDTNGTATFQLPTGGAVVGGIRIKVDRSGGHDPWLVAESVPLAGVDLEGNGSVTPVDRELLIARLGTNDPRCDLDFSGLVDVDDLQILLAYMGHDCTVSGVGPDEADPASNAGGPQLSLYPNPASGPTTVSWSAPAESGVSVAIYDLAGRRVRNLVVDHATSVEESVVWDGRDHQGIPVAGGVYLVLLQMDRKVMMRRLVIVR